MTRAEPSGGVRDTDQINLTDEESRIMPCSGGGGFDQCHNAQAVFDVDSMLIVGAHLSASPSDVRQLAPMLEQLSKVPDEVGHPASVLADVGFFSQANIERSLVRKVRPLIARRRDQHYITRRGLIAFPNRPRSMSRPVRWCGWRTTCKLAKAAPCTDCVSRPSNPCLASSSR